MSVIKYKDSNGKFQPIGTGKHTHLPSDIGAADKEHGHDVATESNNGFMSASDKADLNKLKEQVQENYDAIFGTVTQDGLKDLVGGIAVSTAMSEYDTDIVQPIAQRVDNLEKKSDNNTTYSLSKSGSTITLTGSDGSSTSVTDSSGASIADAGDSNTPVYFTGGKPVACTSLDLNTTGNAETATKLQTERRLYVDLARNYYTSFDGSEDTVLGAIGTLGIALGGTGATTASGALAKLGITSGQISLNITAGSHSAQSVSYGITYSSAPNIVVSLGPTDSVNPLALNVQVINVGTTNMTIDLHSDTNTASGTACVYWIAIGTPAS